jgi:hypothetical protein
MEQWIQSMGPAWVEVRILAQRALSQVEGFNFLYFISDFFTTHILVLFYMLILLVPKYIYLLCRFKINHMIKIWNVRLSLSPIARLQTLAFQSSNFSKSCEN